MDISLTPHLEALVKKKVDSGVYTSSSDVICDALRLLEQRDRMRTTRVEDLKMMIQDGIDSGNAGPVDVEEMIQRGHERLAKKHSTAKE